MFIIIKVKKIVARQVHLFNIGSTYILQKIM